LLSLLFKNRSPFGQMPKSEYRLPLCRWAKSDERSGPD
jgi:hypothetical protein